MNEMSIPITCIKNVENDKLAYYRMETAITNKPILFGGAANN